eukprot:9701012-Lingulodinium_polyedra.AAC.1
MDNSDVDHRSTCTHSGMHSRLESSFSNSGTWTPPAPPIQHASNAVDYDLLVENTSSEANEMWEQRLLQMCLGSGLKSLHPVVSSA